MDLIRYLKEIALPDELITPAGETSQLFRKEGIFTLWEAILHVWCLPYGRTSDRGDFRQVLPQRRGTCSGKHALIAALARELAVPLKLYLGVYLLTAKNRPKIASLLEEYRLPAIPEAHTYLKFEGRVLDITFPDSLSFTLDVDVEQEEEILPEEIGLAKEQKHREYIQQWAEQIPLETIWEAREKWIQSLQS